MGQKQIEANSDPLKDLSSIWGLLMKSMDFLAGNLHKSKDFIKDFKDFTEFMEIQRFMDKSEDLIVRWVSEQFQNNTNTTIPKEIENKNYNERTKQTDIYVAY